ncbi:MAG: hypothetical protein ACRC6T_08735 [Sarcina sp.]
MNKNLRTLCAALAISLLPVSATCYAKTNVEERYETIWVEAEKKVEENSTEKSEKTAASEYSIDDVLRFKSDKEKYDANMGKEVTLKLKVCKLKVSDDQSYIMSKDSSMKKAKCVTSKEEAAKCKEGDEVIVVGTLKEIKGNKLLLENTKVIKVIDVNKKEYNKDKYKEKNKCDEKKEDKCDDKCDKDKREESKEDKKTSVEEKQDTKKEDKKTDSKDVESKKEDKKTSAEDTDKSKKEEKTNSKVESNEKEEKKTSTDEKKEKSESKVTNKEEDTKDSKVKE